MAPSIDPYAIACPFCRISQAYPYLSPSSSSGSSSSSSDSASAALLSAIPQTADATKLEPNCFLILNAPGVLAFLDIMPMTPGHLLVTSRQHRVKIGDLPAEEAAHIGFWLPALSRAVMKVVGTTDYNIVQNNGPRAAQVVPHVHFHIIPRSENVPRLQNKSWTMFGRGQRKDLEEDEAESLAKALREQLRVEVEESFKPKSSL